MKQSVYFSDFCDAFIRLNRKENFSYAGKKALYEYLIELEEDSGEEIEMDIIGLCCDWHELSIDEAIESYNLNSIDELYDLTTVIKVDSDTIIYQNF